MEETKRNEIKKQIGEMLDLYEEIAREHGIPEEVIKEVEAKMIVDALNMVSMGKTVSAMMQGITNMASILLREITGEKP